jgi:hypothetical protein
MYEALGNKIKQMMPKLNEKQVRHYLGSEAEALGRGGIAIIARISGKSRNTIVAGIKKTGAGKIHPKEYAGVAGGENPQRQNTRALRRKSNGL